MSGGQPPKRRTPFDPRKMRGEDEATLFSSKPADDQAASSPAAAEPLVLSVSELTRRVRSAIRAGISGTIRVVGQLSNLSRPTGGHFYFTLKDETSEVRCVMWRSDAARLKFEPKDGLEIVATGEVDVFEQRGQYQLYVRRFELRGVGELELAFRQLKERLQREGLFEPARKRPIPRFPRRIAVVTSPTGAAIRDVLQTIQRRFPCLEVLVMNVKVQGDGAAQEIADAVRLLNQHRQKLGGLDVMIVGRGGGSLEDLWAFNEEVVARAIFASEIPVISAVGHEIDFTIADFVADLRAATPTAAAELVAPHRTELLKNLDSQTHRAVRAVLQRIEKARAKLALAERSEWFRDPIGRIAQHVQRVDDAAGRLLRIGEKRREQRRAALHDLEVRLMRVRPQALLAGRREAALKIEHRLLWVHMQRLADGARWLDRWRVQMVAAAQQRARDGVAPVTAIGDRLRRAAAQDVARLIRQVDHWEARLRAAGHEQVLQRGFTITRRAGDGRVVTRARQVALGDGLLTQTASGTIGSDVTSVHPETPPGDAPAKSQ